MKKANLKIYLIWCFAIAYLIQVGVGFLYQNGSVQIAQLIMAVMMWVPALGVLIAGGSLKTLGWKPKNIRMILTAWFLPAVLTAIGATIYFLIFPSHFDANGSFIALAKHCSHEQPVRSGCIPHHYSCCSRLRQHSLRLW